MGAIELEHDEFITVCPSCHQRVSAQVEARNHGFPDSNFRIMRHYIARCRVCFQTLILEVEKDDEKPWTREANCVWPTPDRTLAEAIPEDLRREHSEARSCFNAKAYTATVVMVRRTLEGVCAEHGINKKPLHRAFQEMESTGLIEGRLLEWAQELRLLGNEGAHYTGKLVARQDAADAIALAEALMDYLYVFSAQFKEFKMRRHAAKQPAGSWPSAAPVANDASASAQEGPAR
ncbi:DUF4145 domain-containing protein [Streptomyces lydicus]|uniref:DUF4145 domain-containing protein n=1 Tax=Streptomyces lydicus TaxID=47763 RepID=UPI0036B3C321